MSNLTDHLQGMADSLDSHVDHEDIHRLLTEAIEMSRARDRVITHAPCCSAHGIAMTCDRYRRTHFVEVGNCCAAWGERNE